MPCFPASDPYYQVMYNGLDSMMQRFLDEARLLSRDDLGEANVTSPRLDLLFKLGCAAAAAACCIQPLPALAPASSSAARLSSAATTADGFGTPAQHLP
jgi:hypothetical protein